MDREALLDLIPAYALDALDADERAAVEALLAVDADARQRLDEYRQIAAVIALSAAPRRAPDHLSADLRTRLTAAPPANVVPLTVKLPVSPRRAGSLRVLLAAAAVTALIITGIFGLGLPRPVNEGRALYDQLKAHTESQSLTLVAHLTPEVDGELWIAADGRAAVIRVRRLPELTAAQTFQLWLVDPAGSQSGGTYRFENPAVWNYIVLPLEKPLVEYTRFGVSIEPEGGSPLLDKPSGPRVFDVTVHPSDT
jgi:anti-sigma-K factor RskA